MVRSRRGKITSNLKQNEAAATQSSAEREAIIVALHSLQPQTPLGERLIQLSLRELEEGVEPLPVDDLLAYLGRETYKDVH